MRRVCLSCDEPIVGPWAFRLRIGGVRNDEIHGTLFVQEPCDHFRDHTKTKWMCPECARTRGLHMEGLELGACRAPEGATNCNQQFEPVESQQSESVLLLEWGRFCSSDKGPGEMFISDQIAHVHHNCACDAWGLPLWSIDPSDVP